ncbi:Lrp/AsnC family transcriptional regulator [Propionispora hippei]|uniref:Lrp/AsnC family transcriptional regulator, leucine-responsive regulatory protein n=1 Tax=Propionispora hippei DSM 15287 TaxID=1123003 RepID=A0A1M6KA48_9FIRM|nr:Lrp/AsnC family transcriptional regulator [Propionispora hippei]SHJ55774.1 Lrp/AsnC family transcriptional regulator, leucine-responsive regulatory protein [Propionispora hippei DSM 15287]
MDVLDVRLLKLLQVDGRMTVSQLSQELALSRPSVSERLHRLQEQGVIAGFTARVTPAAVGRTILLFIQVSQLRMNPHEFEKFIEDQPYILECHRVTGTVSYFIKAAVANMNSLQQLVDRLIALGTVNTSIVLSSPISHRIVLPEGN